MALKKGRVPVGLKFREGLRTETPLVQMIDRPILPLPVDIPNIKVRAIQGGIIFLF